jgi:hypothetical protein
VEILANPMTEVQKRQIVTITKTTFTTSSGVITITSTGKPSSETYKPSKPRNCAGPLKFSKVEVSTSNDFITFIAKGKSSVDIDHVKGNLAFFFIYVIFI